MKLLMNGCWWSVYNDNNCCDCCCCWWTQTWTHHLLSANCQFASSTFLFICSDKRMSCYLIPCQQTNNWVDMSMSNYLFLRLTSSKHEKNSFFFLIRCKVFSSSFFLFSFFLDFRIFCAAPVAAADCDDEEDDGHNQEFTISNTFPQKSRFVAQSIKTYSLIAN